MGAFSCAVKWYRWSVAPGVAFGRRALLIAMALLGHRVPILKAVHDHDDPDNARAWSLSVALTEFEEPWEVLENAREVLRDSALHTIGEAQARLQVGSPFTAAG